MSMVGYLINKRLGCQKWLTDGLIGQLYTKILLSDLLTEGENDKLT